MAKQSIKILQLGLILFLFIFIGKSSQAQFYTGSQMSFGKNRVQYGSFLWQYYSFDSYDTYFYKGGEELAVYTARYIAQITPSLKKMLNINNREKIEYIIFNNLSDLKQSNIGLVTGEQYNIGGVTHIIGNKVFLYFDGNHKNFENQIKAGIAQLAIKQMLYGINFSQNYRNSSLNDIPYWFNEGLISYIATDWDVYTDNKMRDAVLSGEIDNRDWINSDNDFSVLFGHSLWKYFIDEYGSFRVQDVLYRTNNTRDITMSFTYSINLSFDSLINQWARHYKNIYQTNNQFDDALENNVPIKKKKQYDYYSQSKISPDGTKIAYSSNKEGLYKIWIYDIASKKSKCIFKGSYKLDDKTDYSFPLISWHPNGEYIGIITEGKGWTWFNRYSFETKKVDKIKLAKFEKVTSFRYSKSGKSLTLSAIIEGQSDIFIYNFAGGSYTQITNDIWDDLYPAFTDNDNTIIFSSNRVDDSLRVEKETLSKKYSKSFSIPNQFDLFSYNINSGGSKLTRLTSTEFANETHVQEYDSKYFTYLSDANGFVNRYLGHYDSTISYIDTITHFRYFTKVNNITNYDHSILEHDYNQENNMISEIIFKDNKYLINYANTLQNWKTITNKQLPLSYYKQKSISLDSNFENQQTPNINIDTSANDSIKHYRKIKNSSVININDYEFGNLSENNNNASSGNIIIIRKKEDNVDSSNNIIRIKESNTPIEIVDNDILEIPTARIYQTGYSLSSVITQLDYGFLNTSYQSFTGVESPLYLNPDYSIFLQAGMLDLFENYRITGGVKLSFDLDNNEYFLSFHNLEGRIDKELIFHRFGHEEVTDSRVIEQKTNEVLYRLNLPFSVTNSLKATFTARYNRLETLPLDDASLAQAADHDVWGGIKLEYIHDDTKDISINIKEGFRYKFFAEYYQLADKEFNNLIVLGADFRHYTPISRNLIWANRFATSTSLGNNRLIYYLGGVDNWLFADFNSEINVDETFNYAYQTLATNMRGFSQNAMNGNSFFVLNSELRFPIIDYLSKKPVKSEMLRTFQIIGFCDVGSAWVGINPFEDRNVINRTEIENGSMTITVFEERGPILGGVGFGLRAKVLGYFVRADWSWGISNMKIKQRQFYLSLNLDF